MTARTLEDDRDLRAVYGMVFDTPAGRRVLEHLAETFGYGDQQTADTLSNHALLAYAAGTDAVLHHIYAALQPVVLDAEDHDGGSAAHEEDSYG